MLLNLMRKRRFIHKRERKGKKETKFFKGYFYLDDLKNQAWTYCNFPATDSICVIVLKGSFFDLKTKEMILHEFSCSAWKPDLWNSPYKSPLIWGWTVRGLITLPTSAFEVRVFHNSWHQNKNKCLSNHWIFLYQKHTTFSPFLSSFRFSFSFFLSFPGICSFLLAETLKLGHS